MSTRTFCRNLHANLFPSFLLLRLIIEIFSFFLLKHSCTFYHYKFIMFTTFRFDPRHLAMESKIAIQHVKSFFFLLNEYHFHTMLMRFANFLCFLSCVLLNHNIFPQFCQLSFYINSLFA